MTSRPPCPPQVANEVRVIDGGRVFRVESFEAYKKSVLKSLGAR